MSLHVLYIVYGIFVAIDGHILDGTYMAIGCEINIAVYCFLDDTCSNVGSI